MAKNRTDDSAWFGVHAANTAQSFLRLIDTGGLRSAIDGTSGDDVRIGTTNDDFFDLSQGGHDTASGIEGDDFFQFGAALDSGDRVSGGDGYDIVSLAGNYAGVTLNSTILNGIEEIDLRVGFNYSFALSADLIAAGQLLSIAGFSSVTQPISVSVDGSAAVGDIQFRTSSGNDTLIGGAGNDFFSVRAGGADIYDGGTGYNRVSFYNLFFSQAEGISIDLGKAGPQAVAGGTVVLRHIADVSGTGFADILRGNNNDNWLSANGGSDMLFGGRGDDFIQIGIGADGTAPVDVFVDGGSGSDDVVDFNDNGFATGGATASLAVGAAQDTGQGVYTFTSIESITGTQFADDFNGDRLSNNLFGGDGADHLVGAQGDDFLYGDLYYTHASTHGIDGPLTFMLGDAPGADLLEGGKGDDWLDSGAGDDTLIGGAGLDRLFGGAGNDLFVYKSIEDSKRSAADIIGDFTTGDRIDLSAIDADIGTPRNQAFHLGATAGHAGDVIVRYDQATDTTIINLYVDADRTIDATIHLTGNVALSETDFVF